MISQLPSRITPGPHWRMTLRPLDYDPARFRSLLECRTAVERAQVRLRGWYFPHLSHKPEDQEAGNGYIAVGTDWSGQLEYWRFYLSGQFLGLYAVRETTEDGWSEKLRKTARAHYGPQAVLVENYFDMTNFLYNVTELYEFASRLCQQGSYEGALEIGLQLVNSAGFGLMAGPMRSWSESYTLSSDDLSYRVVLDCADLVSGGPEPSLTACVWFFERFGWLDAPLEVLRGDVQKFLDGKV